MTLRTINLNLELGQTILVGQNDEPAQITKIEFHEQSGEIAINTTRGPRKVLTFNHAIGASATASCKSQGYRSRTGNKSHKLGKDKSSRVKVGGKKIRGKKYGGPLPDWS